MKESVVLADMESAVLADKESAVLADMEFAVLADIRCAKDSFFSRRDSCSVLGEL